MCYMTGAHLNTDMDELLLINFVEEKLDVMCGASIENKQHVMKENNKRALRLFLNKSLRGCVQSALLWYELLVVILVELGFTLNPLDSCVDNAEIEASQCTIVWHSDDNKRYTKMSMW